jgi:iron complex outermembrane recepter protein
MIIGAVMQVLTPRKFSPSSVLFLICASLSTTIAQGIEVSNGTITVTGTREETPKAETAETNGTIQQQEIQDTRPAHPAEIMERVAGVHVNVTNGEGHMTAIRQPITTKAVYLFLEDGIPTRSTGFFNHNALYEVNIPQAAGVEITKGPGTSLYGSDAIGGVINVLTRPAPLQAEADLSVEAGEHGWKRLLLSGGNTWGDDGVRGDLNITSTDGWRDNTDYDRQSATLRWDKFTDDGASFKTVLAASDIDQQVAGTSRLSEDDYLNNPTANYYPISYREVQALRLSTAYEKEDNTTLLSLTPYVRHNSMDYMPNWSLGYDPSIQKTESNSLGLLAKYRMDFVPYRTRLIVGADIDYTSGNRLEHSIDAFKDTGGIYTSYTVEEVTYNYDVNYTAVSPYVHVETSPTDKWRVTAGLRYDYFEYDYNNQMDDGLLTVFPASMSFPARYNHPSDTRVDFSHFSPKLGAAYEFNKQLNGFVSYRHAFRAPSESQLFRPGSNAESLDLDAVKVDSVEIGLRGEANENWKYEISIYNMDVKDDLVSYVDPVTSDRTTVNAGETSHQGIELSTNGRMTETLQLAVSYSYAEHFYEDWIQRVSSSNVDFSGNEIQSAPRVIANTRITYKPAILNGGRAEIEWVHLGDYWMDQDNTGKYDGHDLYNLRFNHRMDKQLNLFARVINVTDERYATAASISRGNNEFAPGMPRTLYAGVDYKF